MTISIKHIACLALVGLTLVACKEKEPTEPMPTTPLAFPYAEGGGKYTTGGRGGVVYHVTSTKDSNDIGTLRYGINLSGTRTIVFDVSGTINLKSPLNITQGAITIAGQTAPGDGICIAGYPVVVKCSNVIIRFLRFRMGDENGQEADALGLDGRHDVIIDHCSCSWSTDECVSCYNNTNFTLQYCFITESLNNSVHAKGAHGYGGIWGGINASFHHNLMAHHNSRMPRFDHDFVTAKVKNTQMKVDFINNVVYNWGGNSAYGGESASKSGNQRCINYINNYYKPGPATKSGVKARLLNPTTKCGNCVDSPGGTVIPGKFYLVGNYMYGSNDVTADNWSGVFPDESGKKSQCKADARFTFDNAYTKEQSAQEAYETVLTKAGCSLHRDAIDARIVNEVRNGTSTYNGSNGSKGGLIDTPADVQGRIEYKSAPAPDDTDRDGMPDEWETAHGLNPNSMSDGNATTLNPPYTNLEVYLNDLVKHLY
ncbi:MAG: pectate lyase [Paludibacteraceae bacterium]|nr:pectate lyase [Paludibacteraceae bacterium]